MAFPGPGAVVITNEAGEPIGWDYPSQDDPYDPDDYRDERRDCAAEGAYEDGQSAFLDGNPCQPPEGPAFLATAYREGYDFEKEKAQ